MFFCVLLLLLLLLFFCCFHFLEFSVACICFTFFNFVPFSTLWYIPRGAQLAENKMVKLPENLTSNKT